MCSEKNYERVLKIVPKTGKNQVWRGSGSFWGRPGGEKSLKSCPGKFWSILAALGSAKISPNWAKMGPSWSQDGAKFPQVGAKMAILRPSWGQDGHLEPIWGAFLKILGGLGSDLSKNGRSVKTNNSTAFWPHFGVLGGLVGGSWGVFQAILGTSWALLGDLGVKLGTSWQHVVRKLAEDGLRWPT